MESWVALVGTEHNPRSGGFRGGLLGNEKPGPQGAGWYTAPSITWLTLKSFPRHRPLPPRRPHVGSRGIGQLMSR
jgi:hypothetical protein